MDRLGLDVVYIPWYVKEAMDAVKIDNSMLGDSMLGLSDVDVTEKMARDDVKDLLLWNKFMNNILFGSNMDVFESVSGAMIGRCDIYGNDALLEESRGMIDMLSNNGSVEKPFILTYENNTLYVVLKEGFSNFIKVNDKTFEKMFMTEVINFAFKYFKSTYIYESRYFKHFLILDRKNK